MHIALVILTLGPGGAERVISNLANQWVKSGHRITLITLEHSSKLPFYPLDPKIDLLQLSKTLQKPSSLWAYVSNLGQRLTSLRTTLKQLHPDLVLSFIDQMNIVTLLLSRGLKLPIFVSERIDPAFHSLSFIYKILRRFTYPWAHRIIVQTPSAACYFPTFLQKKISIIPNSINPCTLPFKYRKIQKIVSVGRLAPQKDYPTLLKAFENLSLKYPDLTLTIYGEGPERSFLENLIQDFGLKDSVFLAGIVSNIEKALLDFDLFVFPSRFEGFPNALGEAMALGLPVVASQCSGNKDLIQNGINGLLFPVGDVEKLALAIESLILNQKKSENLGKNAKHISEKFGEQMVMSLWNKALGMNSPRRKFFNEHFSP